MADLILSSQLDYDSKFWTPSEGSQILNDFQPKPVNISPQDGWRKRKIAPVGTVTSSGGATATFQIPPTGFLGDCYLEFVMAATSGGNYAANFGLALPQQIRFTHGGQDIVNHEYSAVLQVIFSRLNAEKVARFYNAAGGAASGTARTVYAPLVLPGSSWFHKENTFPCPLPMFLTTESLQLDVDLRTVANVLASGGSGGSITSVKLVYYEYIVSDLEKKRIQAQADSWKLFVADFSTISQTSVATATTTTIDLSGLKNSLKSIGLPMVSVANQDTNHNYVLNSNFNSCELRADGTSLYKTEYVNEGIMDEMISGKGKMGSDSVLGKAQEITFAKYLHMDQYSGSLHSNVFKKLEIDITHTVGANAYIKPVAERNAYIVVKDGAFRRIL